MNNKINILFDSNNRQLKFETKEPVNSNGHGDSKLCNKSHESIKMDRTMHLLLNTLSEEDQPIPIKSLLIYLRNSTKYPVSNIGWLSKICAAIDSGLVRCHGKLLTNNSYIEITPVGRNILLKNYKNYNRKFKITKQAQKRLERVSMELALKDNGSEHEIALLKEAWKESLRNWALILASVKGIKRKVSIEDVDNILTLYAKYKEAQNK